MSLLDKQCEVIAPCSDYWELESILNMDIDALYFGLRGWSRSNRNLELSLFHIENLCEKTHQKGKKALLSFNLMPGPMESEQAWQMVKEALFRGIDGVICSDPSLAAKIKSEFPYTNIHASLGAMVLSLEEAHFWADLGAKRIVLSPHISLEEAEELSISLAYRHVETGVMIFGLKCKASLLGMCRMSSYFDMNLENSGLRTVVWSGSSKRSGICYRACAQEWIDNGKQEWRWGPQVYWDVEKIPALLHAGVKAFKIGGRGMSCERLHSLVKAMRNKINKEKSYV